MTHKRPCALELKTVIKSFLLNVRLPMAIFLLWNISLFALDNKAPWHFFAAVRAGDLATVQKMVNEGFDVHNLDAGGVSGLHYAAAYGHGEIIKYFLDRGILIDQKSGSGISHCSCDPRSIDIPARATPLLIAAMQGHEDIVFNLLKKGASPKEKDAQKCTLLHAAAQGGSLKLIRICLELGLSLDDLDQNGNSPLCFAIIQKHSVAAIFLLEKGAIPKQGDITNILQHIVNHNQMEVLDWLLNHDALKRINDESYVELLKRTLGYERIEMARKLIHRGEAHEKFIEAELPFYAALMGDKEMFDQAMAKEKDWSSFLTHFFGFWGDNLSLIHTAALGGNPAIVQACLEHGLPVDLIEQNTSYHDETALFMAAEQGKKEMVDFLLAKGAALRNPKASTLLHAAAKGGLIELAERCLKAGININARDNLGGTPLLNFNSDRNGYEMVKFLLKNGADINAISEETLLPTEETALIRAARNGDREVMELLLSHGNTPIKDIFSLFNYAVGENNIDRVEYLLNTYPKIKSSPEALHTALSAAVNIENIHMMNYLLRQGAKTRIESEQFNTLLHDAAATGSQKIVDYLLKMGISLNEPDENDRPPIFYALHSVDLLKHLIALGADPRVKARGDWTLLHEACGEFGPRHGFCKEAPKDRYPDTLKFLLDLGLDANAQTKEITSGGGDHPYVELPDNLTPLQLAVLSNDLNSARILIAHGAKVDNFSDIEPPLFSAIRNDNLDMLKLLVEQGSDINQRDFNKTPLLAAIELDHREIVAYLKKLTRNSEGTHGKDGQELHAAVTSGKLQTVAEYLKQGLPVDTPDDQGKSPLFKAVYMNDTEMTRFLLDRGANIHHLDHKKYTPLHEALESTNTTDNLIWYLLEQGADINAQSVARVTPLHLAALRGKIEAMGLLIEEGAKIDIKTEQFADIYPLRDGATPLYIAVKNGRLEATRLLIQHGADIRTVSASGETLLHAICWSMDNQLDIAQLLIAKGASVNAPDFRGKTALLLAVKLGRIDIVQFLLNNGADGMHRDQNGWTALHHLANSLHPEVNIARILLENKAHINALTAIKVVDPPMLGYNKICDFPADSTPLDVAYEALDKRKDNRKEKWALIDFLKKNGAVAKTCQEPERKK